MIPRPSHLPKIFIGSSTENLEIAETIQELLDFEPEPTVWSQGVFRPSQTVLLELVRAAQRFEFAIFVFTPDDILSMRGTTIPSVRDNAVFELGLFMGALGPACCFMMVPRGANAMRLPTDLLGLAPIDYRADRSDGNLAAALAPACLKVRRAIREQRDENEISRGKICNEFVSAEWLRTTKLREFVEDWNSPDLLAARAACRELPLDQYDEEFQAKRPHLKRVFKFLNELAEAALSLEIRADEARPVFERPVLSVWNAAHILLAPPNLAGEWWNPPPALAKLAASWRAGSE